MAEEADEPFLVAPRDEPTGVAALNSIDSWPSLSGGVQSGQASAEAVRTFSTMSTDVQTEFAVYPGLVQAAFHKFAESADSISTVEWIIGKLPAMMLRKDCYGCIPIEVALESANGKAVRLMLKVARGCQGMSEKLLAHRDQQRHTLLMLAVNLNSSDSADIIQTLVRHDPSGIYRCYNTEGMNVFHICAKSELQTSFCIILDVIASFESVPSEINLNEIKKALEMTDSKQLSPIHYICVSGRVAMLDKLVEFANTLNLKIDFDVFFAGSSSCTPLMVGVEKGQYDACRWLLQNGSVNVHKKQDSTCLTALHFAVKTGHLGLVNLLLDHGADADFWDSDCDDLLGYKTPLELAKAEAIPNKQACIKCLSDSLQLTSQTNSFSKVRLRDMTNRPSFL